MTADIVNQIQQAYDADRARVGSPVTKCDELPLAYEDITLEWLNDVLCTDIRDAEVTSFKLGSPDHGTSNRRRIYLKYNKAGERASLPKSVFCKASHELANRMVLGVTGAVHSEFTFYNEIRPELDIQAPQCYYAAKDDESMNYLVMLEDLTDKVESFCTHLTPINKERAKSQMALLAEIHGSFCQDDSVHPVISSLGSWPEYFRRSQDIGMEQGSNNGFLAAEKVIPPALYKRFDEIWPATLASVEHHHRLPSGLTHNDVHLKNWYVLPNDQMGLGDWQACSTGHGSRDVAYALSTSLTVEDRRDWEKELIEYYLDQLARHAVTDIKFDDFWDLYREQLISSLTWWTITLTPDERMPDMQPRDITLEFIRRITIAMDDLDSLDAIKLN